MNGSTATRLGALRARDMDIASDEVPYCSGADWTCGFLEHSEGYFHGITEHWYALNTTGLLFKLYGERLGASLVPVAVSGNSPQPPIKHPLPGETNRREAGSPTYPLVAAALSPDRRYLTVAVVNATGATQLLALDVRGARLTGVSKLWEMG
ncbi:MAG: hypothetical protein ACREV7_00170 [Steroidobacteraceae bacterium]